MVKKIPILEIQGLKASVNDTEIVKNLNLIVNAGEIHAIMGKNGSGKSTFAKIVAGHPAYRVTGGDILFYGESILDIEPEQRSQKGIFLGFQYPIEIAGVTNYDFLRIAYNEKQKYLKKSEVDPLEFMSIIQVLLEKLKIKNEFLNRNLNEGFSGGEKKRNEVLQMLLLAPKLVILDEIDSGLDIDALKIICENIHSNLPSNSSLLVITHYPKILTYLKPTFIHIMKEGKIIKTGKNELIDQLEENGYQYFN